MKKEKLLVKLSLLYKRLKEYKGAAFFGVDAQSEEVLDLWKEYNELREELIELNPELFSDLKKVNPPEPSESSSFTFHEVGAPVYNPGHFDALENQTEKAIEYSNIIINRKTGKSEKRVKGDINISATEGSLVNLTVGDNNEVLQNTGRINRTLEELNELGVSKYDLATLKEIISQNALGKESKISTGKKIMHWMGNLTTKLVEKGLTDNLSTIIGKVETLIDLI